MKKKHWTQTPKGRRIIARNARAKALKESEKLDAKKQSREKEIKLAHIQGKIEAYVELHALSAGLSYSDVAQRIRETL